MIRNRTTIRILACALTAFVAGGCTTSRSYLPWNSGGPPPQQPVEPIPAAPVQIDPLPALPTDTPPIIDDQRANRTADGSSSEVIRPVITTPPWRRMMGRWTARDALGSCSVTLTSISSLDFYRAKTSGCANKDLAKVSSWEYRNGEVYLYQPGGVVAARLRGSENQLSGVIQSSGADLTLSK
ncbi:MAG: protease inhibitor Inh/omp19 family protein [Methylobacteriaceae bacterium]|jgi:hypothetical protein|nr:protease inhibitor Inh/omp19 family protein [Methylobacteriaceae bacterium]